MIEKEEIETLHEDEIEPNQLELSLAVNTSRQNEIVDDYSNDPTPSTPTATSTEDTDSVTKF
jgi:hypothetical protein